ncbi:chemotaxis protein CheW [Roseomonas sp. SSH11]|uniref:Chemotaxis protein CheW n=1 Tax=Pararoseomonas baculiformis TaxID=2820812 RepID=A0ABS4A8U7_9PROT|nr:chemotaxis protein CheW [Pararoseomonas baculiformis]MBP0443421.1 chemotaxis protein CheW [Pararoseomonas baculiformis]
MALRFLPDPGIIGAIGEDRATRLIEERTERLARRGTPGPALSDPVLLLAVGEESFGLPLVRAAEVLPAEPPCPLPGSPPEVLGLRARAGRLHTVLDLATLLGVAAQGEAGGHDVLLRPLPGMPPARRLALRVGRVLSAASPLPLPPDRAPPVLAGIAFHAVLLGRGTLLAVIDIEGLLRPYAAPSVPSPHSSTPHSSTPYSSTPGA